MVFFGTFWFLIHYSVFCSTPGVGMFGSHQLGSRRNRPLFHNYMPERKADTNPASDLWHIYTAIALEQEETMHG